MSKRDDIMKIWQESFKDSRSYVTMYFERVYRDDEAMLLTDPAGTPVSSLLLQQYSMSLHGSELPVSYIAGAATRRSQRGKGYMSQLMTRALRTSAERGDMLCTLIPASSALYWFYNRYGFSTVFYTKEQRFTSLHSFPVKGEYSVADTPASDDLWEAFDRFQHLRPCYVLHTRRQFDNILADLEAEKGDFVVMTADDPDSGPRIVSMAWAVRRDDLLLGAVAASDPALKCTLRVTDHLLPELNSHTYRIADGVCETLPDSADPARLDFDVTVSVLAEMAFSSPAIGSILRFPAERPMISLMLD